MNAYFGGFAAAMIDNPVWVMNVVPVKAEINTLDVVFERGLVGTYQNWYIFLSFTPRRSPCPLRTSSNLAVTYPLLIEYDVDKLSSAGEVEFVCRSCDTI
ncbi:unnamed protein product [Lathyrus sativus]|nr:unnamed protein product [Lathyrus sativus]